MIFLNSVGAIGFKDVRNGDENLGKD